MRALSLDESKEYIKYRLSVAGFNNKIFDDDVYPKIYNYTGGIPRLINTLCDTALTCAFADNRKIIDNNEFEVALNELQWKTYDEMHKHRQAEVSRDNASYSAADVKDINQGSYNSIASRALVEISRQLKRIADSMERNK